MLSWNSGLLFCVKVNLLHWTNFHALKILVGFFLVWLVEFSLEKKNLVYQWSFLASTFLRQSLPLNSTPRFFLRTCLWQILAKFLVFWIARPKDIKIKYKILCPSIKEMVPSINESNCKTYLTLSTRCTFIYTKKNHQKKM